MSIEKTAIPKRIANSLINSLKGGVVPRTGLPYVTVGREKEIEAFLHDIDIISDGGASFRFIVGKYGSGKSFLLQTVRNYVMDKGFVVVDADLSPERRLQGTKGQGLATYRELVANMSTKTRPDGGALTLILDKWISGVLSRASETADDPEKIKGIAAGIISHEVESVEYMVHGFDFARLLKIYFNAYVDGNDEAKGKVVKWFKGEYSLKSEVKSELGVNILISDEDWYEYLKLFSAFLKAAGYSGLIILIDELVNIFKIPNSITRQYNYEKMLTMYNDTLQGKAKYLGIVMCATPQCLEDTRRGIYSYEALRQRLSEGKYSKEGMRDLLSPVIRLEALTAEEMYVLCEKLSSIHAVLFDYDVKVTENDLASFVKSEYSRIGSSTHITPREVIRDFIELLDIMHQNPGLPLSEILGSEAFSVSEESLASAGGAEFEEFEI